MSLLADQNRRRMAQGGLSLYNPTGRAAQRPRAPQRQQQAPPKAQPKTALAALKQMNSDSAAPKEEDKGLATSFFNTAVGGALGTVLNNKVVKSVLQPLDILGVPGRAIGSAIQEGADLIAGNDDASFGDFYNQTNPFFFAHGEDSGEEWRGLGDTWQQHGKALGAGNNRWIDAGVGLVGDVATDPLTYAGGIGVVDKGLDALRTGSRLNVAYVNGIKKLDQAAAGPRVGGGTVQGAARDVMGPGNQAASRLVQDAVEKLEAGAAKGVNEAAGKGSRGSLTGRPVRTRRTSQATELLEMADGDVLDALYGGTGLKQRALAEVQHQAGRGLGAWSKGVDQPLRDVVETALNIKPPALRARVPFARQQGKAILGTEGLARAGGKVRQGINETRLGRAMIDSKSPLDEERAMQIIARGEKADPTEFARASRHINAVEGTRAAAGEYLVEGLNMARGQRKNITAEIKAAGGAKKYLQKAETEGGTTLNKLFDAARTDLAGRHGITIPDLSEKSLYYVQHAFSPEFRRFLTTTKGDKFADDLVAQLGGTIEQDLLKESGRLSGRNIGPNMELPVPGAPGKTFNTLDGTIDTINREAARAMQANGVKPVRVLEDSPMNLIDDYIQAVSEDVGRRVSRADQIAKGNPDVRYNATNFAEGEFTIDNIEEALKEQRAASKRLGLNETDDQIIKRLFDQTDEVLESKNATTASRASYNETMAANRKLESATGSLTYEDVDGITRVLGTRELPKIIDDAFARWEVIGTNKQVMMTPEANELWKNARKVISDPGPLMKVYRELNKYFKNFAVLTPGFHVRNGLSAIFMNIADGVPLQTTARGIRLWKRFSKASKNGEDLAGGMKFIDGLSANEQAAFRSVFGSGAGGRFTEAGQAQGAVNRASRFLTENRVTRSSQDAGAFVEGSVRMGMALDTIENGGSLADSIARITRVQFDYSQTSRMDDKMKQIMPFYSFMSRNIPLQVMQQWSRPGAYQAYEHFKNNFGQPEVFEGREGEIPGYIEDGGGMPLNLGPLGNWFEPDLPHTRVGEDVERYMNVLNDPLGATSGVSPIITAPLEFGFKQDAFTGQRFEDDDLEHVSNPLEMLAILPAWATKTLKMKDGEMFIEKRTLNALQAVDPLFSRASRLTGAGGQEQSRVIETIMRTGGLPVRNITPKQMENAARGARFDEADRRAVERAMERAIQGN